MIGSETFVVVTFRCSEKRTPCSLASAICSARKASSARRRITAPSTISPSTTGTSLSTVTVPSSATCSRSSSSASSVTDRSVERKSPSLIVATWVFESFAQSPMV